MILSNGDLSYVRQREHALCPCGKLMQYLRMTLEKRQKRKIVRINIQNPKTHDKNNHDFR